MDLTRRLRVLRPKACQSLRLLRFRPGKAFRPQYARARETGARSADRPLIGSAHRVHRKFEGASLTQKWPLVSRFPNARWGVAANKKNASVDSPAPANRAPCREL